MRKSVDCVHGFGLQLLGICAFLYFLAITAGVLSGLANDRPIGLDIFVGLVCGSLVVYFMLPKTMPDWLRNPVSVVEGVAILFSLVVAIIFVLGPMAAVAVAAFDTSETTLVRHMLLALLPSAVVALGVTATGLLLGLLPAPEPGEAIDVDEDVAEDDHFGIGDVATDYNVPALSSVRMMRLSRT